MDSDLFNQWFSKHFLLYAPLTRPILLLLDGHSTHFNPVTIELAAQEKVIIFCLPPHSSHRTQPLDKGCFGPLKQYWRQQCHEFLMKNPGRVVTRYDFSNLFANTWYRGMSITNVIGGFKNTGIYPFDRDALLPQSPVRPSLSQRTGISYIPLFSPRPRPSLDHSSNEQMPAKNRSFEDDDTIDNDPDSHSDGSDELHVVPFPDISVLTPKDSAFTQEENIVFSRRLEEGYDLPDPRYDLWLSIYQSKINEVLHYFNLLS